MLAWTRSNSSSLVASSLGSRLRCAAVSLESGMTRGRLEEARFSTIGAARYLSRWRGLSQKVRRRAGESGGGRRTSGGVGLGGKDVTAPDDPCGGSRHDAGEGWHYASITATRSGGCGGCGTEKGALHMAVRRRAR